MCELQKNIRQYQRIVLRLVGDQQDMEYIYEIQPSFDKPRFHHTDFSSTHLHLDRCVHFLKLKILIKFLFQYTLQMILTILEHPIQSKLRADSQSNDELTFKAGRTSTVIRSNSIFTDGIRITLMLIG